MNVRVSDYVDGIKRIVIPNAHKYVHVLAGLCNPKCPTADAIKEFFNGGEITATAEMFNALEGLDKALDTAIYARLECYHPCTAMLDYINKSIYNDYKFYSGSQRNIENFDYVNKETDLLQKLTNPKTIDELAGAMVEILRHNIYTKYYYPTIILYVEAVLAYDFCCIWNIADTKISSLRCMIAEARGENPNMLIKFFKENLVSLVGDENKLVSETVSESDISDNIKAMGIVATEGCLKK